MASCWLVDQRNRDGKREGGKKTVTGTGRKMGKKREKERKKQRAVIEREGKRTRREIYAKW